MSLFFRGVLFVFSCVLANAAALVPVPTPPQPSLPVVGLEANKGQAKPAVLFLSHGKDGSLAVTAQSVLYSPLGGALTFVASNPNPTLSFSDPLPGLANSFTGAGPHKWITGIPRYATATLGSVYPGINAQYTISSDGSLTLNLELAPAVDPQAITFQLPQALSVTVNPDGSLTATFIDSRLGPRLVYPAPAASQPLISRPATFVLRSTNTFGVEVLDLGSTGLSQGLQISIPLNGADVYSPPPPGESYGTPSASDAAGNTFFVATIADAAGKDAPFPTIGGNGCGIIIEQPFACSDVAVYKFSASGVLEFVTYLAGQTSEGAGFVGLAPDGSVVIAGSTNSADFPITAAAFQPAYAGPAATAAPSKCCGVAGDFFAARLDPSSGLLLSSTFLGGPNADTMGTAALGSDGSLYFLPKFIVPTSEGMPVTGAAVLSACQASPCQNGYAARLSPMLDRLIYGTYLPGISQATAQLYSDGSVYYAGTAAAGFPTTANAYQALNAGGYDGIVARLDPTGSRLLFATYFGGPNTDWILGIAVAPDGSAWAAVSSFIQCCINIQPELIHLDASGSRLLARLPINADSMVADTSGNLIALAEGGIAVSPDAILGGSCGGPAYIELSPTGQQLFATYLPGGSPIFNGADAHGKPYLQTPSGTFQLAKDQATPPYVGCVVDASFTTEQEISPGAIVTIFGAGMGPSPGVGFQLVNGQAPTSLGGTQVLVNGEPAPILYSSYGQLNLIIPYSLAAGSAATLQVVSNGTPLNQLSNVTVLSQAISIFLVDANGSAAALNEDYTVNSPPNPARPGSTVMLFGTGGGQTNPPSMAGEVTPLELRPLLSVPQVAILYVPPVGGGSGPIFLNVEYAGAAPALLSGVTQINVTLPDVVPTVTGYPAGTLPLTVTESGVPFFSKTVTISVSSN